jgi:hypothetical protein
MTDLETRLRDVRPDGPPLGFDPDEVADRAAGQARSRAAGIGGALVAVAAVVAALVFGLVPDPASPAAGPVPPPLAEQARIRQALTDAVTRAVPGVRELTVGRSAADVVSPGRMSTTAGFADASGRPGHFQLTVRGPGAARQVLPPDRLCSAGSGPRCTRVPQPGGALLVLSELAYEYGNVTVRRDFTGFLYRPDGSTVVVVVADGYSLTREQLTKVITDPAFVLP